MKFKAGLQPTNGAQNSHFKKLPNPGGGGGRDPEFPPPPAGSAYQWRIQEFQNRGCSPSAVEFLGSEVCVDAPSHIPYLLW